MSHPPDQKWKWFRPFPFASWLLFASSFCAFAQSNPVRVNVCQLFDDMSKWNGQLVEFEAKIEKGGGERANWISGEHCTSSIDISGVHFDNFLVMGEPGNSGAAGEVDRPGRQTFKEYAGLMESLDRKTEYLGVTIRGVFETKMPLSKLVVVTKEWPKGLPNGFGHLNAAPGRVLVMRMADLRVRRK